jgi:plasmid stabilization system protein ParE
MPVVEIDPRAEEEARVAFLWYLDRSENAAAGFQRDFELAVQRIAEAPTAWAAVDGELRRCLFDRFPYALIYSIGPNSLRVIAVAHQHRKPGYWNRRS